MIEELESRRMWSVTVDDGVLTVNGTAADDVIIFDRQLAHVTGIAGGTAGPYIVVNMNDETDYVPLTGISRIVVRAGAGDDVVSIPRKFILWRLYPIGEEPPDDPIELSQILPATVFGEDGDDRLVGGNGDDVLRGGSGNDTLRGRSGDDRLFGGRGVDQVFGGAGDDMTDIHSLRLSIGCEIIRATGLLRNDIEAIGGDTTGWHLQQDDSLIELDFSNLSDPPTLLVGQRVRVWGSFQTVDYVERGPAQVLFVTSITKASQET